jgi:hypothetical protein
VKKIIFRTVLVGSLALFAACGGSSSDSGTSDNSGSDSAESDYGSYASEYPSGIEENFISSCTSTGGNYDACKCVFDYIADQVSYERFTEIENEIGNGSTVDDYPVFSNAAESCT